MVRFLLLPVFISSLLFPNPAPACELRLLLALDASASLSDYEYNLQRTGISAAFRDPLVASAIASMEGGIWVALTQWAGIDQQELTIGWTRLTGAASAEAFARQVDRIDNPHHRGATALGDALRHAGLVLEQAPERCWRTVIDVSGDGVTNVGVETAPEADMLAALGVTINGLAIMVDAKHYDGSLEYFYARDVARGPGAFVMAVATYNQFPEAFRAKLLRELQPQMALE